MRLTNKMPMVKSAINSYKHNIDDIMDVDCTWDERTQKMTIVHRFGTEVISTDLLPWNAFERLRMDTKRVRRS